MVELEAFSHGKSLGRIALIPIGGGFLLREDAAYAWVLLRRKSEKDGVELKVDDAFRTMEEQEKLWARHQPGGDLANQAVARPGHSNHQSGIALDIEVHRSNRSAEYLWLAENAPGFGWHNVGGAFHPPEFWHWEFTPTGGST